MQHMIVKRIREKNRLESLAEERKSAQPVFISVNLYLKLKKALLDLLKEYKDVFEWTYAEMPVLDQQVVRHQLNIREGTRLI